MRLDIGNLQCLESILLQFADKLTTIHKDLHKGKDKIVCKVCERRL